MCVEAAFINFGNNICQHVCNCVLGVLFVDSYSNSRVMVSDILRQMSHGCSCVVICSEFIFIVAKQFYFSFAAQH